MPAPITDGLDALRAELSLADIMRLIERTARWVSAETFKRLPVWYPEHSRRGLFYKANWSEPQLNINRQTKLSIHKSEGNLYANKALTSGLGMRARQRQTGLAVISGAWTMRPTPRATSSCRIRASTPVWRTWSCCQRR